MSKRIPCTGSNPPRNTPNKRPHKSAKPKGCWLKDGQRIAANASPEVSKFQAVKENEGAKNAQPFLHGWPDTRLRGIMMFQE